MLNQVPYLIEHHSGTAIVACVGGLVLGVLMIFSLEAGADKRRAENEAYWKAKLECRQSGGSYEWFGTEGYACIKPKTP